MLHQANVESRVYSLVRAGDRLVWVDLKVCIGATVVVVTNGK